jgi:hypothetical protein
MPILPARQTSASKSAAPPRFRIAVKNNLQKNRLKRDRLVFFFPPSGKLTRYERIKMRASG